MKASLLCNIPFMHLSRSWISIIYYMTSYILTMINTVKKSTLENKLCKENIILIYIILTIIITLIRDHVDLLIT